MKNHLKHLFNVFLLIVLVLFLFSIEVNVKAIVFSDNQNASYDVKTREDQNQLGIYTSHVRDFGETIKSNVISKQQINVFTQTQTADSKVVTWAIGGQTDFRRATIIGIAQDYEKNHPGWIVVGGINADQYTTGFGQAVGASGTDYYFPQPYYPMICDGEGWFTIGPLANGAQNVAGFLQDGSKDPIVSGHAKYTNGDIKFAGYTLSVLDENDNVISSFTIENYNTTPKENETTIYTSFYQKINNERVFPSMDISGNLYIVEDAIRAYPTNSSTYSEFKGENGQDAFFGKGLISKITDVATISKGQFAISTNNASVKEALSIGTKILVQIKYEGVLSTVESAIGYHTIQRMDNVDQSSTSSYNTQQYPRAIFGRKADGKICLIAIDGNQASKGMSGTSHDETNAVIKYYGLVEAYQMDGGGSVTAMIRDENDRFVITNSPSDGSARSVLSALLFVERNAPEAEVKVEASESALAFDVTIKETYGKEVAKVILYINNKEYELVDGKYTITGLKKGREFSYSIFTEDKEGCRSGASYKGKVSTTKSAPKFISCKYTDSSYYLVFDDPDNTIVNVSFEIDNGKYPCDNMIVEDVEYSFNTVLVYTYNTGNEDVTVKVRYPDLPVSRFIDQLIESKNQLINNLFK